MAAHRIYFHLTWSTFRRQPMIDGPTRSFLDQYFRSVALAERVEVLALAFLRTHVHMLLRSGPTVDLSRIVRLLKGGSSYAASRQPQNMLGLRWNKKYSVTTVSPRALSKALEYLQLQEQRHPSEVIPSQQGAGPSPV